jgi:hypothetical protein
MSGGVSLYLQTSKGLDCLYLFRFMGHHQLFGLIGGHSINQSYMSEWNEDCIYLDDGKIDSSNEIGGVGRF